MRSRYLFNESSSSSAKVTLTIQVINSSLSNLSVMVDRTIVTMTYTNGYYNGSTQVDANSTVSYNISATNYTTQSGTWSIGTEDVTQKVGLVLAPSNNVTLTITVTPEAALREGVTVYTSSTPIDINNPLQYLAMNITTSPSTNTLYNFRLGETFYFYATANGYTPISGSILLRSTVESLSLVFL